MSEVDDWLNNYSAYEDRREAARNRYRLHPFRKIVSKDAAFEYLECGHRKFRYEEKGVRRRCETCWVEDQQLLASMGKAWPMPKIAVCGLAFPHLSGWDFSGAFENGRDNLILLRERLVLAYHYRGEKQDWVRHGIAFQGGLFHSLRQHQDGGTGPDRKRYSSWRAAAQDDALVAMREAEEAEDRDICHYPIVNEIAGWE